MSSHCSMLVTSAVAASRTLPPQAEPAPPPLARAIVRFWIDAGPARWFAKDPVFDREFRERFFDAYEAAARGEFSSWLETAESALALCLLLDQYPRNAFRGTARMYATDGAARAYANAAIRAGHDRAVLPELATFMYLPFAHSEDSWDQDRSVELCAWLGGKNLEHAERHRSIVRRFGRFPHRNPLLGRTMTPEEQRFLDEGGFAG